MPCHGWSLLFWWSAIAVRQLILVGLQTQSWSFNTLVRKGNDVWPSMVSHTWGMCSAFNPSKCSHTAVRHEETHIHTLWTPLTEIFVLCTQGVYLSAELASSAPSHSWIIVYQGCWLLSSAVSQTCLSIQGELECRWGLVNWPNAMHWVGRNARLPLSAVGRSSVPCLSVWCSEELTCGDGSWVEQLNPESSACSCRMEVKCGIVHQTKWFFQEVLEW